MGSFPLRHWFDTIDTSRDGALDSKELQKALALGNLNFSLQTVAHMIRLHDRDLNGTISFPEFQQLHEYLMSMQATFTHFDTDRNTQLSRSEVDVALKQAGFNLDGPSFTALFQAYDPDRSNSLGLTEFIAMSLFLKSADFIFKAFDPQRTSRVSLDFNQFIYASSQCR